MAITRGNVKNELEYKFTDLDFDYIRNLVTRETGIVLSEAKRNMIYNRLARRLRALNISNFREYCSLLERDPTQELNACINAITTNLTSFFREPHHFDYLQKTIIPELLRVKSNTRRIRIWSAGCSSGEEPYSIAMAIKEVIPHSADWDWRILATDIDTDVLVKARCGIYTEEDVEDLARGRLHRWFVRGKGKYEGLVKILPEVQEHITFKQLNLMHEWPIRGPIDAIFCRNVIIYFDKENQKKIIDNFADRLAEKSWLLLGHSETLYRVTNRFKLIGQTMYEKRS